MCVPSGKAVQNLLLPSLGKLAVDRVFTHTFHVYPVYLLVVVDRALISNRSSGYVTVTLCIYYRRGKTYSLATLMLGAID